MAISLDGFVARADGGVDWLSKYMTEGEDNGFGAFMDSVDGLVMGRASYENVLTFGGWHYTKPTIVMSQTLTDANLPEFLAGRVRFSSKPPNDLMQELEAEGWKRVYVDGGKIVQSFLAEGLIEDMTLTRVPILLGRGKPLFGPLEQDLELEHIETQSLHSGLVTSKYRVC
ncbi:MAG: dihydrofolate reductase family protein [Pseudomonadota bacterium]